MRTKEELSTAILRIRKEASELEPSREMSLVLTKLDEAALWLKRSKIEDAIASVKPYDWTKDATWDGDDGDWSK